MKGKVIAAAAASALLVLALAGCSSNESSSSSSSSSGSGGTKIEDIDMSDWPTDTLKLYDEAPQSINDFPKITPDELHELMESGEPYLLVDVNNATVYDEGHIEGAVNIPWELDGFTQDPDLPRGVEVVFYCVCAEEEDSGSMALSATQDWAYRNIVLLKGGTPAWEEAGYELVAS